MPPRATQAFVISDLHLGGAPPQMMSCPAQLGRFINRLAAHRADSEDIELVIAGDVVDFLAIEPHASWTPDAQEARSKLKRTMCEPPFGQVFDALGRLVHAGHGLIILVGNHDVELALPPVQDALLTHLQASPRQVRFVDDGRAYRIGGALIEHGNRYDGANFNDWAGLRAIASALSRNEEPPVELEVSAGSRLVDIMINPIKKQYPFIDLLQPQGELVALLLLAFEPRLIWELDKLARLLHARKLQDGNAQGKQPIRTRHVQAFGAAEEDTELARVFGDVYTRLVRPPSTVGALDITRITWQARKDSLAAILKRGDRIPAERLAQIRVVLQRLLVDDDSARLDGPTEQYGAAAERLRAESGGDVEVVVMGHTHLARQSGSAERASYINTGTWADVIRVPHAALEPGGEDELAGFLTALWRDERPRAARPYAELRVETSGAVSLARLQWEPAGDDA